MSESALRQAVEQKLARKPFTDAERAEILIEGVESAEGRDRFRARVTQRDRRGSLLGARDLEAQSCASLLRAATLLVSLMIDPYGEGERDGDGARASTESAPRPEPAAPPPSRSRPVRPPAPRRLPEARVAPSSLPARPLGLDLSLGLGAGAAAGVLPSTNTRLLALARLDLVGTRWSFDWIGGYSLSQRVGDGSVRGEFAAVDQQVRGCVAFVRFGGAQADACGGFMWGAVIPKTTSVDRGDDSWRVIAGPTAALGLQLRTGPARVRLDLGVAFPFREYSFVYLGAGGERKQFYSTDGVLFFVSLGWLGTISS